MSVCLESSHDCVIIRSTKPFSEYFFTCLIEFFTTFNWNCWKNQAQSAQNLAEATDAMVQAGVTVVVSASNTNGDACAVAPASSQQAITVGALDQLDNMWFNSARGRCVDIWTGGVDIVTAHYFTDTSTRTVSGTSFAAPIVAGMACLYLQQNPNLSPAQVKDLLLGDSVPGIRFRDWFSPDRIATTLGLLE